MSDEIHVTVSSYGDGRNLMMVYRDPISGRKVARSSGTTNRREAERRAAVWQDELNSGRYQSPSKLTWAEFRRRYETEKLASRAPRTQATAAVAFGHLERVLNPDRLAKLTSDAMSRFQAKLRAEGMRDVTIAKNLRHIRAALSWGVSMGMLAAVPKMHAPERQRGAKLMKGRPITAEEFDRLLLAVPKVRPHDAPDWIRLLRGLWLSGLRLGEAVALSWDESAPFYADLTGRRPCFRILAEAQKSGRDEVLPMTPDFAQFLAATPKDERVGRVFKLLDQRFQQPIAAHRVGEIIVKIGKRAGVIVDKAAGKFASAHDLRRSFGTRWAKLVRPVVLMRLMRHSAIQTTMLYYVDLDTADVADEVWTAFGNTLCNSGKNTAVGEKTAISLNPYMV